MRVAQLALVSIGILQAQSVTADLDRSVSPCSNFYQFACGTWLKNNPVPADQSIWGRFNELDERNRATLREILEKAAAPGAGRTAIQQKTGDYYAACMDEKAIEAKGIAPLRPELDRIAKLKNRKELGAEISRLHAAGAGALFNFGSTPDMKNSKIEIAEVDQGGLGLPDRDYYLKTDAKSVELRGQYLEHVRKMFELAGDPAAEASKKAETVMKLETALASSSLDRVARRAPANLYHKLPVRGLVTLAPSFEWRKYFHDTGAPAFDTLNVTTPDFFKAMEKQLGAAPLEDWKTYLSWHLLHARAALLPAKFVDENFDFFGKKLTGARELKPRWKRCAAQVDGELGDALGQLYVERTFGAEGKERTLEMVKRIEAALGKDVAGLDWMTPETKKYALEKLHAITNKIGYPDKWRDYGAVRIDRGDAAGNSSRAVQFEFHRQMAKIGKPVDRSEWEMTPPTVNAYYDGQQNNINFPAGILQPPFFLKGGDDAANFGAIGAVIGHELTHGFDDEGRQFDAEGNLRDWWTAADAKEFEKRAQCFVDQYSGYTAIDDVKLNGKLTLGENTADNGGVRVAYMALLDRLTGAGGTVDGFTAPQRAFLGWAQIWCVNRTPEAARMRAVVDPHSPGEYRVNGVLSNMPEFQDAFGCQSGQPMAPVQRCRVW